MCIILRSRWMFPINTVGTNLKLGFEEDLGFILLTKMRDEAQIAKNSFSRLGTAVHEVTFNRVLKIIRIVEQSNLFALTTDMVEAGIRANPDGCCIHLNCWG